MKKPPWNSPGSLVTITPALLRSTIPVALRGRVHPPDRQLPQVLAFNPPVRLADSGHRIAGAADTVPESSAAENAAGPREAVVVDLVHQIGARPEADIHLEQEACLQVRVDPAAAEHAEARGVEPLVDGIEITLELIVPVHQRPVHPAAQGQRHAPVALADRRGFQLRDAFFEIGAAAATQIGCESRVRRHGVGENEGRHDDNRATGNAQRPGVSLSLHLRSSEKVAAMGPIARRTFSSRHRFAPRIATAESDRPITPCATSIPMMKPRHPRSD